MPFDKPDLEQSESSDSWKATLSHGDVVRFRFPIAKPLPGQGRPKRRPCLVLEVITWAQRRLAKLAYGTSADTNANRGYEVRIREPDAIRMAGLDRPSRFVCARTLIVSLDNPAFAPLPGTGTPVIGHLDDSLMARMNAVRARLDAEAAIAADARAGRHREQRRWRHEGDGFRKRNRALRTANAIETQEPYNE